MRILLDENVSPRFGKLLVGHEVEAVAGSPLRSTLDGPLIEIAEARFDAFVTMDKSILHQQNLKDNLLIIVLMRGPNNRYERSRAWRHRCWSSLRTPCPARSGSSSTPRPEGRGPKREAFVVGGEAFAALFLYP